MTRWCPAEDAVLRRMAGQVPAAAIAQQLGRTTSAVHKRARRLSLPLHLHGERRHGTKWPDALVEQARQMYDRGHGPVAIAACLNVPRDTIASFVYFKHRRSAA